MKRTLFLTLCAASIIAPPAPAAPAGNTFTYQGRLGDGGQPAHGSYDLQFALRDALTGGATHGGPMVMEDVTVQNGLFTVTLDFGGDAFSEGARWLEIGVRPGAESVAFTLLSPRQAITAAPLALHALQADTAAQAVSALSATTAVNATKAASADAVAWNHVSGLPAGFADGTDNDTTYSAGAGLTLGAGNQFALNFAGSGALNTAARSDHSHFGALWSGASSGNGLSLTNTSNTGTAAFFRQGAGSGHVALGGVIGGLWADAHDGPAVFGTGIGAEGALAGRAVGNGAAATGVSGVTDSSTGRGVYGHATFFQNGIGTPYGVFGESESPSGAGVKAVGAGAGGTALELQNGGIKVNGAGVNTATPVFVHQVTAANIGGASEISTDWWTMINHPLCNGRPNAIIIVTPVRTSDSFGSNGVLELNYRVSEARWVIEAEDYYDGYIKLDARFNVIVVNP